MSIDSKGLTGHLYQRLIGSEKLNRLHEKWENYDCSITDGVHGLSKIVPHFSMPALYAGIAGSIIFSISDLLHDYGQRNPFVDYICNEIHDVIIFGHRIQGRDMLLLSLLGITGYVVTYGVPDLVQAIKDRLKVRTRKSEMQEDMQAKLD